MSAGLETKPLGYLSNSIENIYAQVLTDLRGCIVAKYETIADFIDAASAQGVKIDQSNLYHSLNAHSRQKMSLELYIRLCTVLGIGGVRMVSQTIPPNNLKLIDYLAIDNGIILLSLLELQYQGS